jgi:2-polyprenyl-6-hydroxyphenyl methylase/3-demethylubiquinone-9 3-methyltransferase
MLPSHYRIDGSEDFQISFAPEYLQKSSKVYDIGGGKNPFLTSALKEQLAVTLVGLDIDQHELHKAPTGAYDEVICADITRYEGNYDADLVICKALLEHVEDIDAAFAGIASILKPGGVAVIFVPSKNAIYARLNIILPETFKRHLLYTIFPQTRKSQGFISYYDKCTPKDFECLAKRQGLEVESKRCYFLSSYFSFFFPLYLLWRIWILIFRFFAGEQAAETFSMAFKKQKNVFLKTTTPPTKSP